MPLPLLIDTDPGQDDAIAILLALGSETLDLKGLTVTSGNVGLAKCVNNALRVLEIGGRGDIPVYSGADRPLFNKPVFLEGVFGEDGLAGAEVLPTPNAQPSSIHAVDALLNTYQSASDTVLAAIAPMTNIAMAIQKNPNIARNIPKLVIMGGCPYPEPLRGELGNIAIPDSPHLAEYNFAVDPHAADIVLRSGIADIHMIGLNVTRAVLYGEDMDRNLRKIKTKPALAIANILASVGEDDVVDYASVRKHNKDPVRAIHDAVALAYAEDPTIFKREQVNIIVPPTGKRAGQSIIDDAGIPITIAVSADNSRFEQLLLHNISRL